MIHLLLSSHLTQRRLARVLKLNRKTVVRKLRYLSLQEQKLHTKFLKKTYRDAPLSQIQFDDLETSEHTKCKPLSVSLAVDPETRRILSFQVNAMPARGLLAEKARRKYGRRLDERPKSWNRLMKEVKPYVRPDCVWMSDDNPHYPKFLKRHHPKAIHIHVKGGRGASTGQGELKKLAFDPIFALNHTCAMLRANLSRLIRRTWSTTKKRQGLIDHLWIYVGYHNRVLTRPKPLLSPG